MPDRTVVRGATADSTRGLVPNRLEINDLIKDEKQFSLYIQALIKMMYKTSQDDPTSHFQISGIHGMPYTPWDGAEEGKPSEGYCEHASPLFPTWHRPYMMLYEQVLQGHAIDIAETYVMDKEQWQKAAIDLRQPYWDWAKSFLPPPEVISMEGVTITTPDGERTTVENPLYQYRFHPIEPTFKPPFKSWGTTLRRPDSKDDDAKSDVKGLLDIFAQNMNGIRDKTFKMLTRKSNWYQFSNEKSDEGLKSEPSHVNSLETLHGIVHYLVGEGSHADGHMADVALSGFDPIFYLHHAQVDRLLSLWSAIHPDIWVTVAPDDEKKRDVHSDLVPFRNTASTYWTSTSLANTAVLGYTYPEFNGLEMGNADSVKTAITKIVVDLYGSTATSLQIAQKGVEKEERFAIQGRMTTPPNLFDAMLSAPFALTQRNFAVDSTPIIVWEWTSWIRVKKYEVGSSFSILLFLGEIPDRPEEWRLSPKYAGSHYAFVNSTPESCANCREQSDVVIEGFVHLDEKIVNLSKPPSLEPDVIEPYLKRALNWAALKSDGTVIDIRDLPSLEITTIATPMKMLPGETLPEQKKSLYLHSITHGRPGGSRTA